MLSPSLTFWDVIRNYHQPLTPSGDNLVTDALDNFTTDAGDPFVTD